MEAREEIEISLTLNNVTRKVVAKVAQFTWNTKGLFVNKIEMMTSSGTKKHVGWMYLRIVEGQTEYSLKDAMDVRYSGMRGNGHARPSSFRHIGFAD